MFEIPSMDCSAEENLIRLKLEDIPEIRQLEFNLSTRILVVFHEGNIEQIEQSLFQLNLGGKQLSSEEVDPSLVIKPFQQKRLLWTVLIINFAFFILEISAGFLSRSMGLVADSLDMLADALVYAISLLAVGGTLSMKKKIASIAGYSQMVLAAIGFLEVLRRFWGTESYPDFSIMISVSVLALIANSICLYLLQQSKSKEEVHMKASLIFTSNDVIINLGVIVAGLLVYWSNSNKPDLIVGAIVFALVMRGANRILALGR